MTLLRRNKRAQSTGEYAILFAIVLGGVFAMQGYVRNRISAGIQNRADVYSKAVGTVATVKAAATASTSSSATAMTKATVGVLGSKSTSTSKTVN